MGFFQELKENLSQAVNELMPEDQELQKTDVEEETVDIMTVSEPQTDSETGAEEFVATEGAEETMIPEVSAQEAAFAAYMQEANAKKEETVEESEETVEETVEESEETVEETVEESEETVEESVDEEEDLAALEAEVTNFETEGKPAETEETSPATKEIDQALEGVTFEGSQSFAESAGFSFVQSVAEEESEVSDEKVDEGVTTKDTDTRETDILSETLLNKYNGEETKESATEAHTWGERRMDTASRIEATDETAIITAGMTVNGDISSQGSLNVIGNIEGNVDIFGKLNITGTINGNSRAAEIFADSARITGEVCSEGSVKIGQSSVIIGNITASSAVIAGAVKGDIDVKGPVILDTSAIVMGNIKSKSVQINNGAVIEGMCSQCYADVSPSNFFSEFKK